MPVGELGSECGSDHLVETIRIPDFGSNSVLMRDVFQFQRVASYLA